MSQHDMNIENQGFPAFRSDLNNALAALASTSAGATAPSTTFAQQLWYDSTNNLLKMRNTDNDAWITLAYFDQTNDEWEVRSAVIQAVDSAGVVIKTDDGTTRLTIADDGSITTQGDFTVGGDLDVSSGTIKLDGNYPVGTDNVALGNGALDDGSLTGANNIAIGASTLTANTSGARNVGVGHAVLSTNSTGSFNTAVGFQALQDNTASDNTAYGYQALNQNETGSNNVAVGRSALAQNISGGSNIAIGRGALDASTTASDNVAIGREALGANLTGTQNVAVGYGALDANTSASDNTAVGYAALGANETGANNTAVGHVALDACISGNSNTAVGADALTALTTATTNTAIGQGAGQANQTGGSNTYIGRAAGTSATGEKNTFVGNDCGELVTSGSKNTILGRFAGNQFGFDIRTEANKMVVSDGDGFIGFHNDSSQWDSNPFGNIDITANSATANLLVVADEVAVELFNGQFSGGFIVNDINRTGHVAFVIFGASALNITQTHSSFVNSSSPSSGQIGIYYSSGGIYLKPNTSSGASTNFRIMAFRTRISG